MKRAALSAPSQSIAPPRCAGLLAMTPSGRPSTRISAVTMPMPNSRRSSSTESVVGERRRSRGGRRRCAAGSRGSRGAAAAGRRTTTRRAGPGSTTGTAWPTATASASSATAMSTTPFGTCTAIGPTSSGRNTPSPPPSIIAGPAHADVRVRRGDDHVAAAEERGVAGEAAPRVDADERHQSRQLGEVAERQAVEAGTPVPSVSPGRPPPPSVKNTTGRRQRSASSNRRSFLRWFCVPCVPASTV